MYKLCLVKLCAVLVRQTICVASFLMLCNFKAWVLFWTSWPLASTSCFGLNAMGRCADKLQPLTEQNEFLQIRTVIEYATIPCL